MLNNVFFSPSLAIQALRSVLNSFCVVNRKNMFVYQERTTKSVFYLRLYSSDHSLILHFLPHLPSICLEEKKNKVVMR